MMSRKRRTLKELVQNWAYKSKYLPYRCLLLIDSLIFLVSGIMANVIIYGASNALGNFLPLCYSMLLYLACAIVGFRLFKTYCGVIRYTSIEDFRLILGAMSVTFFLSLLVHYLSDDFLSNETFFLIGKTDILIMCVLTTLLMWIMRVAIKHLYNMVFVERQRKGALIYGILEENVSVAQVLRKNFDSQFRLTGFLSETPSPTRHSCFGKPIMGIDSKLQDFVKGKDVQAIIVLPQQEEKFRRNVKMQNFLKENNLHVYMYQGFVSKEQYGHTESKIVECKIEDLLPRDEINVDMEALKTSLTDKTIMVTGAAGSIGSELVVLLASFNPSLLILVDQAETPLNSLRLLMVEKYPKVKILSIVSSIVEEKRMNSLFERFRPKYVFHAAAYKHVPMMEDNACESIHNNVLGTKIIADLSVKYGVEKFVMVSTDKAVNPTSVMGCSKRICEIYVQSLDKAEQRKKIEGRTQFVTTRFGNVLGSNGSVIPLFEKQIQEGGPVTVTHPDIVRFFMLIPEACKLVLEASVKGHGGEIFVFDMGEPVKIVDLASRMIQMSGKTNVQIKYTGLRPGEKLYEEVLNEEERCMQSSFNPLIKIAKVREYDYSLVEKEINSLIELSSSFDDLKTVSKMKEIVPEYKSNNSIFEKLDK